MNVNELNFNFLIPLDVPQKLKISHNLVQRCLQLSEENDKSIAFQTEILNPYERRIYVLIENLAKLEDKFIVAKIEYVKKFNRFLKLTPLIEEVAEKQFSTAGFVLVDVDSEGILWILEQGVVDDLISILERTCEIINDDIKSIYNRIGVIMIEWTRISNELQEKIRNFEHRGMKYISTRLKVKITPILAEMQEALRVPFTEDAPSRNKLIRQFEDIISQVEEDIFGNLSVAELDLYNEVKSGVTSSRIIEILSDENLKSSLIELILDQKLELKLNTKINKLF